MKNFPDRLTGNWILVEPLPKKEEKLGSLIIPESANSDLREGVVMKVSPDAEAVIKVGEIAIFPTKLGLGQIINQKPHLWLEVNQLWAINANPLKSVDAGDSL